MRGAGLEPARVSPHAPQTCVYTNSTTRALGENAINGFILRCPPLHLLATYNSVRLSRASSGALSKSISCVFKNFIHLYVSVGLLGRIVSGLF